MSRKSDIDLIVDALLSTALAIENGDIENHDVPPALRDVATRLVWEKSRSRGKSSS